VQGIAPFSRIQATATDVSSPPEKAIPTFSPTGRDASTFDMGPTLTNENLGSLSREGIRVIGNHL
jgi:hypothetical protein